MFHAKAEVVERMLGAIEGGYLREAGRFLSDDFTCSGFTPEPLDKEKFLALNQALFNAMPDLSYDIGDVREGQGDTVAFTVRIAGTNTGGIDIPLFDLTAVPATGRKVALPAEQVRAKVRGDKVSAMAVDRVPGGGIAGLLRQLGLGIPEPAVV